MHLLGPINTVLDIFKIEAGQFKLNIGEYALGSIVDTVMVATESLAATKKLAFKAEVAKGLPYGRRASSDAHFADICKFDGIAHKVEQHLGQALLVAEASNVTSWIRSRRRVTAQNRLAGLNETGTRHTLEYTIEFEGRAWLFSPEYPDATPRVEP